MHHIPSSIQLGFDDSISTFHHRNVGEHGVVRVVSRLLVPELVREAEGVLLLRRPVLDVQRPVAEGAPDQYEARVPHVGARQPPLAVGCPSVSMNRGVITRSIIVVGIVIAIIISIIYVWSKHGHVLGGCTGGSSA